MLKWKKYQDNQKAAQQTASVGTYFTLAIARLDNVTASTSTASFGIAARQLQPTLNPSNASNDLLSAEVMSALKTMDSHYLYSYVGKVVPTVCLDTAGAFVNQSDALH